MLPNTPTDAEPARPEAVGRKLWLWLLATVGLLLLLGAVIYRWARRWLTAEPLASAATLPKEKAMARENPHPAQVSEQNPIATEATGPQEALEHTVRHAPARAPATATDTTGQTAGYEPNDVRVGGVFIAAIALFVMIGVGLAAVIGLLNLFGRLNPPPPPITLVQPQRTPDVPTLWFVPEANRQDYQVQEDTRLGSYGWVDQANGVAHIPITQAMQLVIEQGLPARDQAPPTFGFPQPYQLESEGGAAKEPTDNGAP